MSNPTVPIHALEPILPKADGKGLNPWQAQLEELNQMVSPG